MPYLLNVLLVLTFLFNIHVNWNKYVKKRDHFVFIMHQVNKYGVSRRWFTEADVEDFKIGALTTPNITRRMVKWKKEFFRRYISRILFIDTEQLSKMQFLRSYFSQILLINSELPTLKMVFLKFFFDFFFIFLFFCCWQISE